MSDIAMFNCFFTLLAQEKSQRERRKDRQKCGTMEKLFIIKPVCCFKLMTISNLMSTFETDGTFAFITVHKQWLHDKQSMCNYELWTMWTISRESHFYGTLCWWKMLILNSFKWYQSTGDSIRFIFWSLWTKWHHYGVIRGDSKFWTPLLNWIFLCQKSLCKMWYFIHKMDNSSLHDSTNTGGTAKFFSSCC